MRRFSLALAAVLIAGCSGAHTAADHGYQTKYGISPHAPGFATKPPPKGLLKLAAPQGTLEMFDSIIVGTVPSNPSAVAGYTAGSWPTFNGLVNAFPHARHVSIAIGWGYRAQCLDDEPGDATPSEVVPWVRAEIAIGNSRPCVYASVSQMFSDINPRLSSAGLAKHVRRWCAWYRYFAGLISGCDAVQWTDHALGRNLDQSTVALSFFGAVPKPRPDKYAVLPAGYVRTAHGRLSERASVKAFDSHRCGRGARCDHFRRELKALEVRLVHVIRHSGSRIRHRALRLEIMRRRSG